MLALTNTYFSTPKLRAYILSLNWESNSGNIPGIIGYSSRKWFPRGLKTAWHNIQDPYLRCLVDLGLFRVK